MIIHYKESPILAISTDANVAVPLCMDGEYPAGTVISKDEGGRGTAYGGGVVKTAEAELEHPVGATSLAVYTNDTKENELTASTDYTYSDGVISLEGAAMSLWGLYAEYTYTASASATLAHTENVTGLKVYVDNTKAQELTLNTDFTVEAGVITLLGASMALPTVYAEYTYGEAPGTPATETATVTAVTAEAQDNLAVEKTWDDPPYPAYGILLNDCTAPADEPREAAVLIAGFVYKNRILGLDPSVEQDLPKITFLDEGVPTEGAEV